MHRRFYHQHHHYRWEDSLTCKPIETYSEIQNFVADPPAWRSLCKDLTPHSKYRIMNADINQRNETYLEYPESFCHFDPDADDPERQIGTNLPKVLVCHDMANGYHDDSYIEGTGNPDAYTFYNWTGIDIFCYFSHHLITIPPLGWINVAHDHGVKVIGTVITEWAEGITFWDNVLANEQEYKKFASSLVAIAKTLKFEGWLLNVENKVTKPELLLEFVQYLHHLLHEEIPDAELIWYDSVTIHGTLNWQNGLNDKNRAYFDACDGIFTNYSWTERDLASSVTAAGERRLDLYIGIDVWGRNFYGGGQFNTFEAVKAVSHYGCSLAIFAPAWTLEAMSSEQDDLNTVALAGELEPWQQFLLRDRALWGSLWVFLNTRLPCRLPFHSSFCKGQGNRRWLLGEVISPGPWHNLRTQQYQPNAAHGPHGYQLAAADHAHSQPHHSQQRDHAGIIRYRDSFNRSRLELFSSRRPPREPEPPLEDDEEEDERKGDGEDEEESEEDRLEHEHEEKQKPKHKVKNAIMHFFRRKKSDETDETAPDDGEREPGEEREREAAGPARRPGRSMMTVSVNLRLGRESAAKRRYRLSLVAEERECLEEWRADAFTGGSCLRVHPSDAACPEHRHSRLFHCELPCRRALAVCVVTKPLPGYEAQALDLLVRLRPARGPRRTAVLAGGAAGAAGAAGDVVPPLEPAGERFLQVQRYLLLHEPACYVPLENAYGWRVRYYEVETGEACVTSLGVRARLALGPVLLGYVGLCEIPSMMTRTVGTNTESLSFTKLAATASAPSAASQEPSVSPRGPAGSARDPPGSSREPPSGSAQDHPASPRDKIRRSCICIEDDLDD